MDETKDQKICIKFCYRIGKTSEETYDLLKQAYGDDVLNKETAHECYMRVKNGNPTLDEDTEEKSGRPSIGRTSEIVDKVLKVLDEDRSRKVKDICKIVGISYGTCRRIILEDLNMRLVKGRWTESFQGHCVDL